MRLLVLALRADPIPRQRVPAARKLCRGDARHRVAHPKPRGAGASSLARGRRLAQERHRARDRSTAPASRRRSRPSSTASTRRGPSTSSPSKIRSSSCTRTRRAPCTSGSCTAIPRLLRRRCGGPAPGAEGDPGRRDARPRNDRHRPDRAETGHLVFSTLHTIDASKTVERVMGAFDAGEQHTVRSRLAGSFRYFISQRLIAKQTAAAWRCSRS